MNLQNKAGDACPRCGTAFACKQDDIAHCDCSAVPLDPSERRYIALKYRDCLCNACLLALKAEYREPAKLPAIFCWSGGKDSAFALYQVLLENRYEIRYLLTTVHKTFGRVSMHGVREELLQRQAQALALPLLIAEVEEGSNAEYERRMEAILLQAKTEGIAHVIFGDIFLEDLRTYREANLARVGMKAVFPLWQRDTGELLKAFVTHGFQTVLCCVNDAFLDESWLGRRIDAAFADELPGRVDPCGEHGEYHSFCYDGPVFARPVRFSMGGSVYKPLEVSPAGPQAPVTKGFWFLDLLPE